MRMTLEEFAVKIGVSTGTVSYALSGKGKVKPETRERVLRAAKELGFSPNRAAANLASGVSRLIAIQNIGLPIESGRIQSGFDTEFVAKVLTTLHQELAKSGYAVLLATPEGVEESGTSLVDYFLSHAIDGAILLNHQSLSPETSRLLRDRQYAISALEYSADGESMPLTEHARFGIVNLALRPGIAQVLGHLHSLGHREIIYVDDTRSPQVRDIHVEECKKLGLAVVEILKVDNSVGGGETALTTICQLPRLPTAIVTRTDRIAFGVLREAKRRGLSIPTDLSLVGFDDDDAASIVDPALTTVAIGRERIGELLVRRLLHILGVPNTDPEPFRCESIAIIRDSTGPPPK